MERRSFFVLIYFVLRVCCGYELFSLPQIPQIISDVFSLKYLGLISCLMSLVSILNNSTVILSETPFDRLRDQTCLIAFVILNVVKYL